jgi:hypothetical protein
MKYWEIIADRLSNAGWSLGWVSALDTEGRTIWIADAHPRQRKAFRCSGMGQALDSLPQCSDAGRRRSHRSVPSIERDRALKHYAARRPRHPVPGLSQSAAGAAPRCSTQRAALAFPHAEGDGLSGATRDREFGFISGPAAFVGGVPLTRAMNPWAMPEAST